MADPPDAKLVERARRGDAAAFEALYDRYEGWVGALARRICGNSDDALDVLQETFIYFFRKLPTFELRAQLKTFLYPVVKHIAIRRREKSQRHATLEVDREAPARPEGGVEGMLDALPAEQQEIAWLRFVDGLALREIADALGIPLGTVKSRLHAAIHALRERLQ